VCVLLLRMQTRIMVESHRDRRAKGGDGGKTAVVDAASNMTVASVLLRGLNHTLTKVGSGVNRGMTEDSALRAFIDVARMITVASILLPVLKHIRAAQTGVFELDIRISNPLFIDVCTSFAAETGVKCRNVEKRINAV
jgi:hypothetical protein